MLLLLTLLACARPVPPAAAVPAAAVPSTEVPAAPAAAEPTFEDLVPTELCGAPGPVPTWADVTPKGAEIGGKALRVPFPPGLAVDPARTSAHRITLIGRKEAGRPATVVELLLIPTCEIRHVPPVFDRLTARSVAHLGRAPTFAPSTGGLGDGIYMRTEATVGGAALPLWSAWIGVAGNEHFELVVAATCEGGEGYDSVCDDALNDMVEAIRAQLHHAP